MYSCGSHHERSIWALGLITACPIPKRTTAAATIPLAQIPVACWVSSFYMFLAAGLLQVGPGNWRAKSIVGPVFHPLLLGLSILRAGAAWAVPQKMQRRTAAPRCTGRKCKTSRYQFSTKPDIPKTSQLLQVRPDSTKNQLLKLFLSF